jgi:hypothetical protein
MNFAITACAIKGALPLARLLTRTLTVIPWLRTRGITSTVSKIISGLTISSGNAFGSFGGSAAIMDLRINLSGPAGLTLAGHTDGNEGMNNAKMKGFQIGLEALGHGQSLRH